MLNLASPSPTQTPPRKKKKRKKHNNNRKNKRNIDRPERLQFPVLKTIGSFLAQTPFETPWLTFEQPKCWSAHRATQTETETIPQRKLRDPLDIIWGAMSPSIFQCVPEIKLHSLTWRKPGEEGVWDMACGPKFPKEHVRSKYGGRPKCSWNRGGPSGPSSQATRCPTLSPETFRATNWIVESLWGQDHVNLRGVLQHHLDRISSCPVHALTLECFQGPRRIMSGFQSGAR